jgi:hypothetical protein
MRGLTRALPGSPWLRPDPDLSEKVSAIPILPHPPRNQREVRAASHHTRAIRQLLTLAAGHSYISPEIKTCWP